MLNYIMTNMNIYENYKATINEWLNKIEPYKRYVHYDNFMTENIEKLLSLKKIFIGFLDTENTEIIPTNFYCINDAEIAMACNSLLTSISNNFNRYVFYLKQLSIMMLFIQDVITI